MAPPPELPGPDEAFPVFIRRGDGRAEVDGLVTELGGPDAAGFLKYFFVAKADQTVVMTRHRTAPLAAALRSRRGWTEPVEGS